MTNYAKDLNLTEHELFVDKILQKRLKKFFQELCYESASVTANHYCCDKIDTSKFIVHGIIYDKKRDDELAFERYQVYERLIEMITFEALLCPLSQDKCIDIHDALIDQSAKEKTKEAENLVKKIAKSFSTAMKLHDLSDDTPQVSLQVSPQVSEADMVNNPPHYTTGGIECIDAIQSALNADEYRGFLKGNALKYLWRERHKGGSEDLKKANWYLNKLNEGWEL